MTRDNLLTNLWGIVGPQQNRTKGPFHRIRTSFNACREMIDNDIAGDFVEVGVWKGGITAVMGSLCERENQKRKVWALDSFEGMSAPDLQKDLLEGETRAAICLQPAVQLHNFNLQDFRHTCFNMVGLKESTVNIRKGWVEDTLPAILSEIDKIAVLRVDIDWYEPTKQVLESLYPKVVEGGYIICDDYGCWKGARMAIDEYRREHSISTPLVQTPQDNGQPQPSLLVGTEHYWVKG